MKSGSLTKKEVKRLKREWERLICKWEDILEIRGHTFYYYFETEGTPPVGTDGNQLAVRVVTNPKYLEARFHVYLTVLCQLDSEELESVVVHELLHVRNALYEAWKNDVLESLKPQAREGWLKYFKLVDERSTERLVEVIMKLEKRTRARKK